MYPVVFGSLSRATSSGNFFLGVLSLHQLLAEFKEGWISEMLGNGRDVSSTIASWRESQ